MPRKTTEKPRPKKSQLKDLKVYGGSLFISGKQHRVIVGAPSWKMAHELLTHYTFGAGVSMHYLHTYWSISGNTIELDIVHTYGQGVWIGAISIPSSKDNYQPVSAFGLS
jgi:hypothetical protein